MGQALCMKNLTLRLASLLREHGHAEALWKGRIIHADMLVNCLGNDAFLANHLVTMYGKCGSMEDAICVFEKVSERNVVSWNVMIMAYAQRGCGKEAILLYRQMQQEGVVSDKIIFITVVKACNNAVQGKFMHAHIIRYGFDLDLVVGTSLVEMYSRSDSLEDVKWLFDNLPKRDIVLWNVVITSCVQNKSWKEALQLSYEMTRECLKPSRSTYFSIIEACTCLASLPQGKRIHAYVISSPLDSDLIMETALLNMYGKGGSITDAQVLFDRMLHRNEVTWNTIITICAQNGQGVIALKLFWQMQLDGVQPDKVSYISILDVCAEMAAISEGIKIHEHASDMRLDTDIVVGSALVNMYAKCGRVEDAENVFHNLYERNIITWSTMISAHAQQGQGMKALRLFRQMKNDGIKPDEDVYSSILDACSGIAALAEGRLINAHIICDGYQLDPVVKTALISMYGKCGDLGKAWLLFNEMQKKDTISWTCMIAAFAQHGHVEDAFDLFQDMQFKHVRPNSVTYVSILFACSHAGLIVEGFHAFLSLVENTTHRPTSEHFGCMVNLLGHVGWLDEAEDLITGMPIEPIITEWMVLLGACTGHADVLEAGRHRRCSL